MSTFASSITVPQFLATIDYFILSVIFLANIALVYYIRKTRSNSTAEYLTMAGSLSLPFFVASLVPAWYGKLFLVTQIAFDNGIYNFYIQGLFWYIAYLCFAFFFISKVRAYNAQSLPDLISKMYGAQSKAFSAVMVFIKTLPITYVLSLSIALQLFIHTSFFTATCIAMLALVMYITMSGFRSIVYTNTLHFVFICVAVGTVLVYSVTQFGSFSFLLANLPSSYFLPRGTHSILTMLAWFAIACSTTFISPIFYQHCLAAKDEQTAARGVLIATGIWILIDVCTTFGAMYAKAIIPAANSAHAYVTYAIQLLPNGLKAIFIAGVMGTILPSITACLAIASNALMQDNLALRTRHSSFAILAIAATGICTMLGAKLLAGNFAQILFTVKSYFAGCLLIPILFTYYFRQHANQRLFAVSCMASCISMTLWQIYDLQSLTRIENIFIGCATSTLVISSGTLIKVYSRILRMEMR